MNDRQRCILLQTYAVPSFEQHDLSRDVYCLIVLASKGMTNNAVIEYLKVFITLHTVMMLFFRYCYPVQKHGNSCYVLDLTRKQK